MAPTAKQYKKMTDQAAPPSHIWRHLLFAFLIGGAICTLGQVFLNTYAALGLDKLSAASTTSITLIGLSALLTGLNVYDKIAKFGGAGTIIPITGFANSIVSPAMEFKSEGLVLGLAAKMFVVAGPVLVYGILTSTVYGLILLLMQRL